LGRDLVPAVAARLGLGLTGDAIGVELDDAGRLRQLKPAFGGQVVAPILSRSRPELVTIRPGTFEPAGADPQRPAAEVIRLSGDVASHSRVRWLRFTSELAAGDAAIDSARAIVCVGFGLGSADRLAAAEALARALGGALGATRRVCGAGWGPRPRQIGPAGRRGAPAPY